MSTPTLYMKTSDFPLQKPEYWPVDVLTQTLSSTYSKHVEELLKPEEDTKGDLKENVWKLLLKHLQYFQLM